MSRNAVCILSVAALLTLGSGIASAQTPAGAPPQSSCMACHMETDDPETGATVHWAADVHAEVGLGCPDCHGGNPSIEVAEEMEAAMDPAHGFESSPDRLGIAGFCARCHGDAVYMKTFNPQARVDQLAEYRTSTHGIRNAEGDPVPATCTDCHGVHGIRPVSSPESSVHATNVPGTCGRCHASEETMAPYGIATTPNAEYERSVHAVALLQRGDVAAPACNDCHGNHGATPPGVQSVANVCGQCHGREAMLFRQSPKKEIFDAMEVAECTVCHGHHGILHPTPELFHGGAAPTVEPGRVVGTAPFAALIDLIEVGETAKASWRTVLRPEATADPEIDPHQVEISAEGIDPIVLDATVLPDRPEEETSLLRRFEGPVLTATLEIEPLSGMPIQAGDAIAFHLTLEAVGSPRGIVIRDRPGEMCDPIEGSACLTCHSPGDDCDQATERMYQSLVSLDRELREASALLHRAEVAGMEVSGPRIDLKSKGTTAAVEARALIHAFDPERVITRIEEGKAVAVESRTAAESALREIQTRRIGLAVSLILVVLVLLLLRSKIRRVGQDRQLREDPAAFSRPTE